MTHIVTINKGPTPTTRGHGHSCVARTASSSHIGGCGRGGCGCQGHSAQGASIAPQPHLTLADTGHLFPEADNGVVSTPREAWTGEQTGMDGGQRDLAGEGSGRQNFVSNGAWKKIALLKQAIYVHPFAKEKGGATKEAMWDKMAARHG